MQNFLNAYKFACKMFILEYYQYLCITSNKNMFLQKILKTRKIENSVFDVVYYYVNQWFEM